MRFVNREDGYLYGAVLYATVDGGRHWARIRPPGRILDLEVGAGQAYALAADCGGFAACTQDALYRLGQGGREFIRVGPRYPLGGGAGDLLVHWRSVYLLAPPTAFRITTPTPLWASHNEGRSWSHRPGPCDIGFGGALAAWSKIGLALVCGGEPGAGNQRKTFYISTDAGVHWQRAGQVPGSPHLAGMSPGYIGSLAAANQTTWALGEQRGTILVTHNSGRTWRPAAFTGNQAPVEGWGYVSFIDPKHAVAVPWTLTASVLAFSTTGANAWREVRFPSSRS